MDGVKSSERVKRESLQVSLNDVGLHDYGVAGGGRAGAGVNCERWTVKFEIIRQTETKTQRNERRHTSTVPETHRHANIEQYR